MSVGEPAQIKVSRRLYRLDQNSGRPRNTTHYYTELAVVAQWLS